ncbi:MAG: hypothetical protein KDK12_12600 [Rhodobacteraceae bacterium]|nr:hypothetical protein [Paracoccaceae bacterium]
MTASSRSTALALVVAGFALVLLFLWVPYDIQTGIVEHVRRRTAIGDALAPTVAAIVLLLGALVLFFERRREATSGLSAESLRFILSVIAIGAVSFALMRWAGPGVAALAGLEYRPLRVSVPWKYIGFVAGGWVLVFGLVTLVERRASLRGALTAALMVALLIAVYDLPFEDLLLPPNGDL